MNGESTDGAVEGNEDRTRTCDWRKKIGESQWRGSPPRLWSVPSAFFPPVRPDGSVHPMAREKRNRNEAQGSGTNDELQPQGVRKRRFPLPLLLGSLTLFLSHRPHNCVLFYAGERRGK